MNMRRALAASIGVAERWMTKRNVHCSAWLHSLCCVVSDDGSNRGGLKTRSGRSWVKPHIREHDTLGAYVISKVTVANRAS